MNELLYLRCTQKGFRPRHVCEIGVYLPETSNVLGFIRDGVRATLIEPMPDMEERLRMYFAGLGNVTILPVAVYTHEGTIELCRAGASTFAKELPASPALRNDRFDVSAAETVAVPARRFDSLDDGTIDLLSIDTEGCEWYALQYMNSRPRVISLETGFRRYRNPFLREILGWMDANGYDVWYFDRSDTVFIRRGMHPLTLRERLARRLSWMLNGR